MEFLFCSPIVQLLIVEVVEVILVLAQMILLFFTKLEEEDSHKICIFLGLKKKYTSIISYLGL
jgi:hypothetical protein